MICKRMIINAGLEQVVVLGPNQEVRRLVVSDWVKTNLGEFEAKERYCQ